MIRKDQRGQYMERMTVNGKGYDVLCLLGKGKGGYSYLVSDGRNEYVLKQIHHEPCDYYQFGNKIESELRDYKTLSKIGIRMPGMLEADVDNERILKEYIRGETIRTLVAENRMKVTYYSQIKEMCDLLYPAGINIDYYPTNFVVQDGLLYYIDYECNEYSEKWDFEHWGSQYWYVKNDHDTVK